MQLYPVVHSSQPYLQQSNINHHNCTTAVLQDIDVASLHLLTQKLAPVNCAEHNMSFTAEFPGLCETCKVFRGSLAAVAFMLCWGTFSGSLAPLCPSSPLPALTVGGLISEADKLYSLLLSLQPLSRWRAASVNRDRVLIALGNQQSRRPLMEHAQLKIPLKSFFSKEVNVSK